ncbi:MAG: dTDP-4-dehydrorhamnose 3,5-epimerase [Hyphomicrobiales bacterium]|nr:dTDP-4-dehydrorhamnose 3,5-epimerase [Hyphomicrobiales bacterium]MBV8826201.1 dTDP-4-dehydrorhamnose 3,5-epimerase [Hyphomicrobiales bacterium]MBV9427633.1 dTDP-4-dehydrorhamnose 3,5-epimerase [Bradyrhizobiaceae bacterium]
MKLTVRSLALPEIKLIAAQRFRDQRGYFAETYVRGDFAAAGIPHDFVQDNESLSHAPGTVRGMHFQIPPFAQAKLIRVLTGRIFDVCIDLRRSSPHYAHHATVELAAATGDQLFVPAGFAHGFCTLEPHTTVLYKVDAVYSAEHERGIAWADPALAIPWPVEPNAAILSAKDAALPPLRDAPAYFD